jgi:hypothetical protein
MSAVVWTVTSMQVKPSEDGFTNVVVSATWNAIVSGVKSSAPYSFSQSGFLQFPPPGNPFTPYPSLTQQQVLQWCYDSGVDKSAVEAVLLAQEAELLSPPTQELPLPWA